MALAPRKQQSWMALLRAARCNGLEVLERQADAEMTALAEPVVMRYPASLFRRDALHGDPPDFPSLGLEPGFR